MEDDFWKAVREKERLSAPPTKTGALNIALLFGTAAVALALILTPMLAEKTKTASVFASAPEFDNIVTGSVPTNQADQHGKRYTIRRSILQDPPGSVCVTQSYGGGPGC